MKVFISWSGELSRQVAELFGSWISKVLQGVIPWTSNDDIEKGSIWFGELSNQLAEIDIGIVFLTRENMLAPWILFEAGALSKGVTSKRVCPILIDFEHGELRPPLSQFQFAKPIRDDMLRLIRMIHAQGVQKKTVNLRESDLEVTFDTWWNQFEEPFAKIASSGNHKQKSIRRSQEDMTYEILEITRSIQRMEQQRASEVLVSRLVTQGFGGFPIGSSGNRADPAYLTATGANSTGMTPTGTGIPLGRRGQPQFIPASDPRATTRQDEEKQAGE